MTATQATTTALRVVHWAAPRDRKNLVEVEALAREAGLHPGLVRRLIALGLLESRGGAAPRRCFRATPPRA